MLAGVIWFLAGLIIWTFVEYAIHGWLGHRIRTFVTPIHALHHGDPHRVFAVGVWIPVALAFGLVWWSAGPRAPAWIFSGVVAGFVAYEALHYRIHFSLPGRWERNLRLRHLAHHMHPDRQFGVTTDFWDRVFSTSLNLEDHPRLCLRAQRHPPLKGRSNARQLLRLDLRKYPS